MKPSYVGKIVTALVAIPRDLEKLVQVRQGILICSDGSGNPVILTERDGAYVVVDPHVTVVPEETLPEDTKRFVEKWRAENSHTITVPGSRHR